MFDAGERILSALLTVGGVAGLIALTITASLCVRYLKNGPEEPPEVLKFALTAIIGFYFGTAAAPKTPIAPNTTSTTTTTPSR